MRLPGVVVGLLLSAIPAGPQAGAAPRPGKVVRIERAARRPAGTPRICNFSPGDLEGFCFGKRPEPGDLIVMVDLHHVVATLRVETATALANCAGGTNLLWNVSAKLDGGDLTQPPDVLVAGLIDVPVDPRFGHLVQVERGPVELPAGTSQLLVAVDENGDDHPDLEFVTYPCEARDARPTSFSDPTGVCLEVWYATPHGLALLRTDHVKNWCF